MIASLDRRTFVSRPTVGGAVAGVVPGAFQVDDVGLAVRYADVWDRMD
ncbi:MAG: hypothetical protein PVJ02_14280 [Gemmatimonadota bacterium]